VSRLNERRLWVVSDLDSANGIYVSYNGADAERPVKENALTYGSTVRFGEVCLRLEPGDHRTLADRD
jgi:hypothetical protein